MAKTPLQNTEMSDAARKVVNDEMRKMAKEQGFDSVKAMFTARQKEMLDVAGNAVATAALINNHLQTIFSVVPKIFIQWLELRDQTSDMTRHLDEDYYAKVDEGNGIEFYSTMATAPDNTVPITNLGTEFVPTSLTPGYGMNWAIRYFAEKNQFMLSSDGFAFHALVTTIPQTVLAQFRTDAGQGYLLSLIDNLWVALTYSKFDFWITKKIREPLALYTKTTATGGQELTTSNTPYLGKNYIIGKEPNAYETWLHIAKLVKQMSMTNNIFNVNPDFIRPSSVKMRDIRIYVSVKTWITYKNNLMSQLFNNSEFAEAFREAKIEVLPYVPHWLNVSNSPVTINYVTYDETTNVVTAQTKTVNAGAMTQPILMAKGIPNSMIWMTPTVEAIDDNTVIITHAGSLRMINQTSILGDTQHWSANNANTMMCYELWAAKMVPDAKYIVFKADNLNVNPTTATITVAGDNVTANPANLQDSETGDQDNA